MFKNVQLLKKEIQIQCISWKNILTTKVADDVRHLFWNKVHRLLKHDKRSLRIFFALIRLIYAIVQAILHSAIYSHH